MLNLPASKLRYWEQVIPQLQPYKQEGKTRRFYTQQDIELLKRIRFLREEQHQPIEAVIAALNVPTAIDTRMETLRMLQQLKKELTEIRSKI